MSTLALDESTAVARLLAGLHPWRPVALTDHLGRHGPLPLERAASLHELLERSGLRGRGGAAFPVARKLAAVAARRERPIVVVNATEGEPLSGKDKALLRQTPHLVLDGAALLAGSLCTNDVVVAVSCTARDELAVLDEALEERRARDVDGTIDIQVAVVPDRFVAGEETALVRYLNGGPALPAPFPRVFERGVANRPTLVQNAETVAHVALVARHGASWFRECGTHAEPGTALFTLAGSVRRPGVYEAALGTPLVDLIRVAGGTNGHPQALLIGGYFGTWFSADLAASLTLDDDCLASYGGGLGARVVAVLPERACGLAETARVARFLADESAGQCGPCVNGLDAIAGALERAVRPGGRVEADRLARWCRHVSGRGACRHPDGAVRFVASALDVFARELEEHAAGRRCSHADVQVLPVPARRR